MLQFILKFVLRVIAIVLMCYYLPQVHLGGEGTEKLQNAAIVAVVLSLLNIFVKPFIQLFSLPITFLTLGLFRFVINAIIVLIAAYMLSFFNFGEHWFVGSLIFSIVLSFITTFIGSLFKKSKSK
jgi:putative membrane protein